MNSNEILDKSSSTKYHIPALDGIRAVAFSLVFVAHAGLGHIVPGGFGVTIFFFLSGYLITSLLRIEYEKTSVISLRNFYLRRVYRIFPPMYITLLIGMLVALSGFSSKDMDFFAVFSQMFHFTNYYLIFFGADGLVPATSIYWSLAIEEHFYLVFPLALLLLLNGSNYLMIARMLFFVCVLVLLWRCILVFGFDVTHNYVYHASDTRLDSLLYGCIMAVWGNPFLERNKFLEQSGNVLHKYIILAFCVGLLLFCFFYRGEQFRETFRYTIQGISLFPIFYYAIRHSDWKIFFWLDFSIVRWIGVMSYTLYLSHLIALNLAGAILGSSDSSILRGALGFSIALAFSILMFVLVEKPFARMRRRLHKEQ